MVTLEDGGIEIRGAAEKGPDALREASAPTWRKVDFTAEAVGGIPTNEPEFEADGARDRLPMAGRRKPLGVCEKAIEEPDLRRGEVEGRSIDRLRNLRLGGDPGEVTEERCFRYGGEATGGRLEPGLRDGTREEEAMGVPPDCRGDPFEVGEEGGHNDEVCRREAWAEDFGLRDPRGSLTEFPA